MAGLLVGPVKIDKPYAGDWVVPGTNLSYDEVDRLVARVATAQHGAGAMVSLAPWEAEFLVKAAREWVRPGYTRISAAVTYWRVCVGNVKLTREEFLACLRDLEVDPEDARAARHGDVNALYHIRGHSRRAFRKLAMELHPDLNGGDPAKTERFMRLRWVLDEVLEKANPRFPGWADMPPRATPRRPIVTPPGRTRMHFDVDEPGESHFGLRDFIAQSIRQAVQKSVQLMREGAVHTRVVTEDGAVVEVEACWGYLER